MDKTVLKIALAGLLHDIGKFAQGCMEMTPRYRQDNEDIYQPKYDGRPTHVHALYTAAFIEQPGEKLPAELTAREWGGGEIEDTFLNLAACHHNPRTALQWVVAAADRIASGLDGPPLRKGKPSLFRILNGRGSCLFLNPLVLKGSPGSGKSMISLSVIRWLRFPSGPLSPASQGKLTKNRPSRNTGPTSTSSDGRWRKFVIARKTPTSGRSTSIPC